MGTVEYVANVVIPAALKLLPVRMDSLEARAMLLAIGLQESRFKYRAQIGGPAEGFWQFESGGGWKGVLQHDASKSLATEALATMAYGAPSLDDYHAIEQNDLLACVFARLLLWTHPKALPQRWQTDYAWRYYLDLWRPGRPHRETWGDFFEDAWAQI